MPLSEEVNADQLLARATENFAQDNVPLAIRNLLAASRVSRANSDYRMSHYAQVLIRMHALDEVEARCATGEALVDALRLGDSVLIARSLIEIIRLLIADSTDLSLSAGLIRQRARELIAELDDVASKDV